MVNRASSWTAAAAAVVTTMAVGACAPEIDTDPVPAVMEFDPNARPARVSEPSFLATTSGKIDLGVAGIDVPADCSTQPTLTRAQCEFNQYLESLDGFPTVASARTPVSGPVDLPTATVPANVAVIDGVTKQPINQVAVSYDAAARYLVVSPTRSWPTGAFIWMGVRGYEGGIQVQGKQVVASTIYNLLKRGDSLTCMATSAAAIADSCGYLQLLAQQMTPEMARASLFQLEGLRVFYTLPQIGGGAWASLEQAGIPKAQAVVLWGFPVHSNPVIDLYPPSGLVPQPTGPAGIRLAVNGTLDPATVTPLLPAQSVGTVMLVDLDALAEPMSTGGFPPFTASYAAGAITITAASPLRAGKRHGILVTRGAKDPQGRALVPPPISVLLMARGPLLDPATMKSTVSSIGDAEAMQLEVGRQGLATLLDSPVFQALTQIRREDLAYLFAFTWGTP
jgi:hypothetical protein